VSSQKNFRLPTLASHGGVSPDAVRRYPVIVLKFGSSVLCSELDLPNTVEEIRRWIDSGHRVVAVVSAIGNTTDTLLSLAKSFGENINDHSVAALLATGEATSAALLSLALDRAGIGCAILDETRLGLRTHGAVLNSEPVEINAAEVHRVFEQTPVIVAPGFVGRLPDGSLSLLGRGGSDLTAVFIAQKIEANRCRLVKDVDGIFEFDPATSEAEPRQFKTLTWQEAIEIGGGIVQPKAIDFAAQHLFPVEVAALNSDLPTLICDRSKSFYEAEAVAAEERIPYPFCPTSEAEEEGTAGRLA
jgi:homoserine dehydrogenase